MKKTMGQRIREARVAAGMNQTELAKQAKLGAQTHVSKLENGPDTRSWRMVCRIADALGVSLDDLR